MLFSVLKILFKYEETLKPLTSLFLYFLLSFAYLLGIKTVLEVANVLTEVLKQKDGLKAFAAIIADNLKQNHFLFMLLYIFLNLAKLYTIVFLPPAVRIPFNACKFLIQLY